MKNPAYLALGVCVLVSGCLCPERPDMRCQHVVAGVMWPSDETAPSFDAEQFPNRAAVVHPSQVKRAFALLEERMILPLSPSMAKTLLAMDHRSDILDRPSRNTRPYLARAIGLHGCGTGGFDIRRENNEIWIGFGGLGSGFTPEKQAVILYLDRPPTAVHLRVPNTCL